LADLLSAPAVAAWIFQQLSYFGAVSVVAVTWTLPAQLMSCVGQGEGGVGGVTCVECSALAVVPGALVDALKVLGHLLAFYILQERSVGSQIGSAHALEWR
jgi:hypothetical protein